MISRQAGSPTRLEAQIKSKSAEHKPKGIIKMTKTKDQINVLGELMKSLKSTLTGLLAVEKQKTAILEKGDIPALDSLLNEEQAILMECSSAEARRSAVCGELGVKSVSELISENPGTKEIFTPLHIEMNALIKEIKETNELNAKLLDTRLKIAKFLTLRFGLSQNEGKYDKNARLVKKEKL